MVPAGQKGDEPDELVIGLGRRKKVTVPICRARNSFEDGFVDDEIGDC